jgi:hypothetical protein
VERFDRPAPLRRRDREDRRRAAERDRRPFDDLPSARAGAHGVPPGTAEIEKHGAILLREPDMHGSSGSLVAGGRLEQRQDLSARPAGGKGGPSLVRGAIDPGAERLRAQTKHVSAGLRLQLGVRFAAVWVGEEEERGAEVTDEIADLRVSLGHRAPRAKGASTPVRM